MKVRPIAEMVLVKKHEEKTKSGLIVPGASDVDSPLEGRLYEVVRAGPGRMSEQGTRIPPEVSEGDLVAFRRNIKDHGAWTDPEDGVQYILVEAGKIACVVERRGSASAGEQN